jgi:hypothetical protein
MKRYLALLAVVLVMPGCDALTAHTDVVARAGGHELTVDGTVDLLAGAPRIPAQAEVVGSVAELWVDYTILAELMAGDSTLADLDLEPIVRPYVEQQTFLQLRDQVLTDDTVITEDELRAMFEEQAPGLRVRARHILLTFPEDATDAQRDSVRQLAQRLQEQAAGGEDFAALAREHSQDPGSGQQGGDLGYFERGRMVQPFDEAAFALGVGEVSEVVETPLGLHIIKLEDRETPSFDETGEAFRTRAIRQRQQEAITAYVDSLRDPVNMEIESGAQDVARDLAEDPSERLTGRAASRELVTWQGGMLTAREFVRVLRLIPPQQRAQYASLEDEQMESLLREVATNELVLADARDRGITVPQAEQDSIRDSFREQLSGLAVQAGLAGPVQEGESEAQAVERRVRSLLEGILSGRGNLLPLGGLPYVLREEVDWEVYERAFPQVVEQLEARRESQSSEIPGMPPVQSPGVQGGDTTTPPGGEAPGPETPPDTAGSDTTG